ncbi:MAG: cellulase family glycosylhydrolase [Candidatus Kapaibacterium sp.]|nr:glycoside hydrolase family 5 protein [Bacteroidota bacterium]
MFATTNNTPIENTATRRLRMEVLDSLVTRFQPLGLTCIRFTIDPYLLFNIHNYQDLDSIPEVQSESEQFKILNKSVLDDILRSIQICKSRKVCVVVTMYTENTHGALGNNVKYQLYHNARFAHTLGKMWTLIAGQISSIYSPDDVMFEIINEPNYRGSFYNEYVNKDTNKVMRGVNWWDVAQQPTARMWLFTQEVVISYIRGAAPNHTIIASFDDNSHLDALPYSDISLDKNVIYAVHYYEPDVFTHQGALFHPFAKYISTLQYPYDSVNVASVQKSIPDSLRWILNNYRDFNKSTILTSLMNAKKWADKHNVKIWIGEFGLYSKNSPTESLKRYYQDFIDAANMNNLGIAVWDYDDSLFCNKFTQPGLDQFWKK